MSFTLHSHYPYYLIQIFLSDLIFFTLMIHIHIFHTSVELSDLRRLGEIRIWIGFGPDLGHLTV